MQARLADRFRADFLNEEPLIASNRHNPKRDFVRQSMGLVTETDDNRDAVLAAHPDHPAIAALTQHLPGAIRNAKYDRAELTLTIARESIVPACKTVQAAGYNFLVDVTCVDWYPNQPRFQITYHLLSHSLHQRIRFAVLVESGDPSVDSITPVWPAANFYEREVFDLFGVRFGGHPNLRRIMMPEDYQGNPLRKDFPVEGYR